MRVIYPHVRVFPEAVASLAGWPYEPADTSADDEAYWRLLRDLWASGDDFCLVEQDMVVPPGALAALAACPREWCGVPYLLYGNYGVWHGVTRYRASLTARLPTIPTEIVARAWPALDSAWINHLRAYGLNEAHWHWPAARHLRPTVDLSMKGSNRFLNCVGCGLSVQVQNGGQCPRCGRVFEPLFRTPTAGVT